MQEFGDVLQCHTACHRLERRWYSDVDERVLLNRGGLVAGVQLDLLGIQTDLRGPAEVGWSREPVGTLVAVPGQLDSGSTTPTLGKPGGRLNMGEGDASSISWSSLGTGDSGVILGGMNLVWTTRVVRDRVFCDGAANEGVTSADTRVIAASGLCTREPYFALGETDKARSGATEADPVGLTRCRR